jgi:hypothetical protein
MWLCTRRARAAEGPEYAAVEPAEDSELSTRPKLTVVTHYDSSTKALDSPVSETMGSPAAAVGAPIRRTSAAGMRGSESDDDGQPKRSEDEVAALMIEGQFGGGGGTRGSRGGHQDVGSPSKSRRKGTGKK